MAEHGSENSSPPAATYRRRGYDLTLVVLFVLGLCAPTAGRLTGLAPAFDPCFEKRAAHPRPTVECRRYGPLPVPRKYSLAAFPNSFDAYFGDQLGFRADLVGLFSRATAAGLIPPVLINAAGGDLHGPVLIGRNGWLYMNGVCVENYRNVRPFSEPELEAWVTAVRRRRDWLAARGIAYLFFVAPDKQTIYPEHLPRSVNQVRPESRLDQLMARLKQVPGLTTVDLRPALLAGKAEMQNYYSIDSHWNYVGARIGYEEVCRALERQLPQMEPLPRSAYRFTLVADRPGDLSVMIPASIWRESGNYAVQAQHPTLWSQHAVEHDLGNGAYSSGTRVDNPLAPPGRAVVFHDSFYANLSYYFCEHWRETLLVANAVEFPPELIRRERPALVVDEYVERRLMGPPPANPMELARPTAGLHWAERSDAGLRR